MAVRPIDRFVSALHRESGDELLLETGKTGRVRVRGQERVLLAQEVKTEQIELLLQDVLPQDCVQRLRVEGDIVFPYRSPSGAVVVRVRRDGARLAVSIRPYVASNGASLLRAPTEMPIQSHRHAAADGAPRAALLPGRIECIPRAITALLTPPSPPPRSTPIPATIAPIVAPARKEDADPISIDLSTTGELPTLAAAELAKLATGDMTPAISGISVPPRITRESAEGVSKSKNKIDPLLFALVEAGGSDLHVTSGLAPRIRKDGDIKPLPGFDEPLDSHAIEAWLMEIAPQKARQQFEVKSDADYAYEMSGLARFRVNAFRDRRGSGGVLRVVPAEVLSANQLGLPQVLRELCSLDRGLILVTGPRGSGKSTTLAGMIDLVNESRDDHVITIEDPVEFVHASKRCLVNQREVHEDTESFASGLRAALREDPDVILVGEMRDLETMSMALEAAETGHLVMGALHTNTAVSTIDRIIDQFPTDRQAQLRVMLSNTLKAVIAQTLCRRLSGGRVAALEILLVVPAVANLIREGKTFQIPSVMQSGRALGMQGLNEALLTLVEQGVVGPKEALRVAHSKADLKALLERRKG
jgi:twitching motility protein PilT